jgi:hypothetical protein
MRCLTVLAMVAALTGCAIHPYSGRVVDIRGRPIAKAYIQGWRYENSQTKLLIAAAETDASGHFALPTYTTLHELTVFGFYDSRGIARGLVEVPKPKVTDNIVVLTRNVRDLINRSSQPLTGTLNHK